MDNLAFSLFWQMVTLITLCGEQLSSLRHRARLSLGSGCTGPAGNLTQETRQIQGTFWFWLKDQIYIKFETNLTMVGRVA
ncbi:hypothetical protein [Tritonibacter mobilis]|uniref:hypothetical protein n=1 Tax=Tritonibacter mobilis TaxID=379347 RepID=UPI0013A5BDAF|nr:hypothetical protein [Tritonibacter mobilis]